MTTSVSMDMKNVYVVSFTVMSAESYSSEEEELSVNIETDTEENAILKAQTVFGGFELVDTLFYMRRYSEDKNERKIMGKMIDDFRDFQSSTEKYIDDDEKKQFFYKHEDWIQVRDYAFSLLKCKKLVLNTVVRKRSGHSE